MEKHFLIPIEMCQYALMHKIISPFRIYIYLKEICDGKVKLNKQDCKKIASHLECNVRSVKNNLNKLLQINWIGYNRTSSYYFIRGFDKISSIQGFKSKSAVEYSTEYIKSFKAFVAGAFIGYLSKKQRGRAWLDGRKGRRPRHSNHKLPSFYPVSNLALAKILNVSISTAFQLKRMADISGYISIKKNFINTNVKYHDKIHFKKNVPELAHKVRVKNNYLHLQDIDTVAPLIHYKSRRRRK